MFALYMYIVLEITEDPLTGGLLRCLCEVKKKAVREANASTKLDHKICISSPPPTQNHKKKMARALGSTSSSNIYVDMENGSNLEKIIEWCPVLPSSV